MTILVIKYGYMFRLFLSHPQGNVVAEFRYINIGVRLSLDAFTTLQEPLEV